MADAVEIDAVAERVTAMIVFLEGAVLAAGSGVSGVPDIGRDLREGMDAGGRNDEGAGGHFSGNSGNALCDSVSGGQDIGESVVAQPGNEGAGGGVDNDRDIAAAAAESEHIQRILTVVLLDRRAEGSVPAVVIEFIVNEMPDIIAATGGEEMEKDAGIECAVIDRDEFAFRGEGKVGGDIRVPVEHRIDDAVSDGPLAENEASCEDAGEHFGIAVEGLAGEGEVVGHKEVDIDQPAFSGAIDPTGFEPMIRPLRIAIEPPFCALHGAAGGGLIDE